MVQFLSYSPNRSSQDSVTIFTDGACSGNPGPGGWGAVLFYKGKRKELFGSAQDTTNNRMELTAAINALSSLKRPCKVDLHTDSQYVHKGIKKWIKRWKAQGWKRGNRQPVRNQDLWLLLEAVASPHYITWHWVRGHTGHPENEQADALAKVGLLQIRPAARTYPENR